MSHNTPMPDDQARSGPAATQPGAARCEWMRNEQAAADLKTFADGELPFVQRVAWGWHLRRCAACRKEIEIMEKMSRELRADDAPQAAALDSGLRARILERVAETASVPSAAAASTAAAPSMKQPASASLDAAPRNTLFRRSPVLAWGGTAVALLMFATFTKTFIGGMSGDGTAQYSSPPADYSMQRMQSKEAFRSDETSADRERIMPQQSAEERSFAPAPPSASAPPPASWRQSARNQIEARRRAMSKPVTGLDGVASSGVSAGAASGAVSGGVPMGQSFGGSGMESLDVQRRVHKEAAIAVEVSELEAKSEAVEKMVKSVGGFVASNDLDTGGDGLRRANLLIKIPVARFESVLQNIARLGIVKNKKVSGEDITVQVSDAEQSKTVLANQLEAQVQRFKKAKLSDKPRERHEARMIQIQLAQARARFNLMSRLADLSTLHVQLQEKEKPKPVAQSGFMNELDKTRHAATEAFFSAARVPIVLLMWTLAYSPIWLPLLLVYRYASRLGLRRTP